MDPIDPTKRWIIIESFADYNARTGEALIALDKATVDADRLSAWQAQMVEWRDSLRRWYSESRLGKVTQPPAQPTKPKPIPVG